MTKKKIIFTIIGLVLVFGLTIGGLILFKGLNSNNNVSSDKIATSDDYKFASINNVEALPLVSQTITDDNSWSIGSSSDSSNYISLVLNNTNGATLSITSQQSVYTDNSIDDYKFSKNLAKSYIDSEQGEIDNSFIIKLPSNQSDIEFYVAIYKPTYKMQSSGSDSQNVDSKTKLIAVRSITTSIASVSSNSTQEGVVSSYDIIPTMMIAYESDTDKFDSDQVIDLFKKITFDLSSTEKIDTSSNADAK